MLHSEAVLFYAYVWLEDSLPLLHFTQLMNGALYKFETMIVEIVYNLSYSECSFTVHSDDGDKSLEYFGEFLVLVEERRRLVRSQSVAPSSPPRSPIRRQRKRRDVRRESL